MSHLEMKCRPSLSKEEAINLSWSLIICRSMTKCHSTHMTAKNKLPHLYEIRAAQEGGKLALMLWWNEGLERCRIFKNTLDTSFVVVRLEPVGSVSEAISRALQWTLASCPVWIISDRRTPIACFFCSFQLFASIGDQSTSAPATKGNTSQGW